MATPPETEPVTDWVEDDPETVSTMEMDDEELEFEEFPEEGDALVAKPGAGDTSRDYVPLWRLIEMSQEDRSLRMELADFEDYDELDGRDGDYAGGSLSH